MSESAWIIPADFDGGELTCFKLMWPDTPEWRRLLTAMLYTLTRGRSWDRGSGSIKAAQVQGWRIFDANFNLKTCEISTTTDTPTHTTDNAANGGAMILINEDDMGQVVTEVKFDSDTGELLVYYGHCCVERIGLSALTTVTLPSTGEEPELPITEPGGGSVDWEYTACGKADTLIDRLELIGHAAWNNRTDPYSVAAAIKNANPAYSVSMVDVMSLYVQLLGLTATEAVTDVDIFNAEMLHNWKCYMVSKLGNDSEGFTYPEWLQVTNYPVAYSWLSEVPDLDTVLAVYMGGFWNTLLNLILGRERAHQIMREAVNLNPDCGCGEPYTPVIWTDTATSPTESGYYVGDVILAELLGDTSEGNAAICHGWTAAHDIFGFVFDSFHNITPDLEGVTLKRMLATGVDDCATDFSDGTWDSWFIDTSDNLELFPSGAWIFAPAAVRDEISGFDQSGGVSADVGTPAVPGLPVGSKVVFKFALVASDRFSRFVNLRPIYNVNSPSHA